MSEGEPSEEQRKLNEAFVKAQLARSDTPERIFINRILIKIKRQKGYPDYSLVDYKTLIPSDLNATNFRQQILQNFQTYCDDLGVKVNCGVLFEKCCLEWEKLRRDEERQKSKPAVVSSFHELKHLEAERRADARRAYYETRLQEMQTATDSELLEEIKKQFENDGASKLARFLAVEYLLRQMRVITDFRTDGIRVYDEEQKYYRETGAERIKAFLTREIGLNNTKNTAEEVLHLLRTKTYIYDEDVQKAAPLNLIPFRNGIYDLNTEKLLPHDPKYLFDFQIPVDFKPEAKCPAIQTFFSQVVAEKDRALIYDIFGLSLYRVNYLEKFFVFTGSGANGKSKVLSLLQHFIGAENHSSVTLKQLTEDRFAVARTYKKLVNVGADIGGQAIEDTSILKSASSTDRISGQFKFGQIFDFVPSATLVFSANSPPVFLDDSAGMYRRVETIVFPYTFGNEKDMAENSECKRADPAILDKITAPEELSGLLNIALSHLKTIISYGQLSVVKSTAELKVDYMKYSNPVQAFVEECCIEADYVPSEKEDGELVPASGFLTVFEMYGKFLEFCQQHKIPAKSKDGFSKRLKLLTTWNLEMGLKDGVGKEKERSVRGIAWKANPADPPKPSKPTFPIFNRTKVKGLDDKEVGEPGLAGFLGSDGSAQQVVEEVQINTQPRSRLQQIKDTILTECKTETEFTQLCLQKGWNYDEAWKVAQMLMSVGDLTEPRPGRVLVIE